MTGARRAWPDDCIVGNEVVRFDPLFGLAGPIRAQFTFRVRPRAQVEVLTPVFGKIVSGRINGVPRTIHPV
jgi:hypothetical protein